MKKKKQVSFIVTAVLASAILVALVETGMSITDARMEREVPAYKTVLTER